MPSTGGGSSNSANSPQHQHQQQAKMSTTDGNVRAQEVKQQKPTRPPATFFPLGYKDAAYQWVSGDMSTSAEEKLGG